MEGNYTIIEVKPIDAKRDGISKDLSTLTSFRRPAGYEKAIYLFYGNGDIKQILAMADELQRQDRGNKIDLNLIEFWWHQEIGIPAIRVVNNA